MNEKYAALRANVGMLGQLLGKSIKDHQGQAFLDKIETIRQLAKSSRKGNETDRERLLETLRTLSDDELLPVARAFSQFLNLANVAEQFHTISRRCEEQECTPDPLEQMFAKLKASNLSQEAIIQAVRELDIDLVLTAHPTEVTRRTLIHKHVQLNDCLEALELSDLLPRERDKILNRIEQLVNQAWHTNEIREQRPTPVDEAKWGFAVVENSLWPAIPEFMRNLDERLQHHLGVRLPLDAAPVKFTSWMGGDRDGNPFVTAKVTAEVLELGRWMAVNLFYKDIKELTSELSMADCTEALRARVGDNPEPYRALVRELREALRETQEFLTAKVQGQASESRDLVKTTAQLREPLELCYHSLHACGMGNIADGMLLDVLRKLACFGIHLVKLDIRQDGERHGQVFSELTRYLGMGDYAEWSEDDKQAFLLNELNSRRPLIPTDWAPSDETRETIDTCRVIAGHDPDAFGIYIISMAGAPSDVLAVQLLLKEAGCKFRMPVAPLFETQEDLMAGTAVMDRLLSVDWYRGYIQGRQYVMIGYSDSAKDAGMMAAGWAQYAAMESLVGLAEANNIRLTLFHGRGGTVGRGGAPAHQAILSQPPGSLRGGLRVTEQGEMIRFKFGLPKVAIHSLNLYTSAVLEGNLLPPPKPKECWRAVMEQLATVSCDHYRSIVRGHPDFVPYFRAATPEMELGKLPLGSRPAKRKPNGGVESLRAIPWIFAWTQNRLMLPAWLGAHKGLQQAIDDGQKSVLDEMSRQWPFFRTRLEMLEMVFLKADLWLAEYYDTRLVPQELWALGKQLRQELADSIQVVLELRPQGDLLDDQPWIKESIKLRNPYTDPLNVLQVELLGRSRKNPETLHPELDQALMVTIAGIAAGMRNTG
ncbi:phosphoenolpyruvate carboxylase [Aeromonas rivipollensis]|uniref:phosphoenolpyruvate carboxylase n=1 Tax=Aeromonas rivipollensis TaxID=948519 RepID=UPI0013D26854|nr:phosphoenolpyruvate carboxylase [Aeromonas rivipollensis]NEX81534.1 phosphoenolpyruvate carboxylase [Aeromonas rivipollensis]